MVPQFRRDSFRLKEACQCFVFSHHNCGFFDSPQNVCKFIEASNSFAYVVSTSDRQWISGNRTLQVHTISCFRRSSLCSLRWKVRIPLRVRFHHTRWRIIFRVLVTWGTILQLVPDSRWCQKSPPCVSVLVIIWHLSATIVQCYKFFG